MKRGIVLGALILVGALSPAATGQQEQARGAKVAKLETMAPGGNLYMLMGDAGNTLALVGNSGVVLVDTMLAGWGQPILDALDFVTDKPVTTIINTHTHADHVGSNHEFPTVIDVIAHEDTALNMKRMDAFQAANAKVLPSKTFKDKMSLLEGSDRIDLYFFGAGHTNGDTIVVFPAARVAHVGDLFLGKSTPIIDTANGGSGVAYPQTLAKAVAAIKGVNTVVLGHGIPPMDMEKSASRNYRTIRKFMTWDDLREYAEFNRDFLLAVQDATKVGKSVDEAAAGLKLPEKYRDYGMERAKANVEAIYNELQK